MDNGAAGNKKIMLDAALGEKIDYIVRELHGSLSLCCVFAFWHLWEKISIKKFETGVRGSFAKQES